LEEKDEAFNWLVLILGTMAATLIQTMHLFPLSNPPLTPSVEIQFLKLLFIPLIVLVFSWLGSHLIQNKEVKNHPEVFFLDLCTCTPDNRPCILSECYLSIQHSTNTFCCGIPVGA